jgi:hypothetical protein
MERIHSEILNRQKCADMGAMLLAGATWCADIAEVSLAGSTFLERLSTVKGRSLRYPSDVDPPTATTHHPLHHYPLCHHPVRHYPLRSAYL